MKQIGKISGFPTTRITAATNISIGYESLRSEQQPQHPLLMNIGDSVQTFSRISFSVTATNQTLNDLNEIFVMK